MSHEVRWTAQKVAARIELIAPLVHRRRLDLMPFRFLAIADPAVDPPIAPGIPTGDWEQVAPGSYWGEWRQDFVLRGHFEIPYDWEPDVPAALYLPLGEAVDFSHPEALVYIDGDPHAACDRHHREVYLPARLRGGRHEFALHGWTGLGGWDPAPSEKRLVMGPCAVVQIDEPTRDFLRSARVALGVAQSLEAGDPARARLLNALDAAFRALDTREPLEEGFYASVPEAREVLRAGITRAGPPLDVEIIATGHAHLDVAWLWTLAQSRRKAGRSFHTVAALMEEFPEYHFTQSQPQLYEFVRNDYPELFETIKKRVADGRWEPIGGMWVEADCNVTGAESLARQFLLGRRFFAEHFGAGAESTVLWLPDVFGYCAALPQLIQEAGLEYFMTIKIGWSQYNRIPYDSFWWEGLDGTRVLTHFSTTPGYGDVATYNAEATPKDAIRTWTNFQQKELAQPLLMIYGYGDGGGGPTREMVENIREMEAFPATPRMRQGSVGDFFRKVEAAAGDTLPTWNGELYLEYHRGTYITQGRNKRANRKSEFLLHDAEFLAAFAAVAGSGYEYPTAELTDAWKVVCLNQFHDILPGSSIGDVYVESLAGYEAVAGVGAGIRDEALRALGASTGGDLLVVNPTSFSRDDLAFWAGGLEGGERLELSDGRPVAVQPVDHGTWIDAGELQPFSITPLIRRSGPADVSEAGRAAATERSLENEQLRVELNSAGDIVRIYDKVCQREVLAAESIGNELQAFEDRPLNFDAWDVDIFYDDKVWTSDPATSIEVVEWGPLRAGVEVRRRILHSSYVQRISLSHNSARLDFETTIDWRERHVLLKVAFPVDVLSPFATFEIQWGNVQRPTHRNTSWDWARFESCAQKWVDLSEGGYGVSLLNDCKYGHDVRDNLVRLSLLRSPTSPDPEADQGEHRFTYALLPHAEGWSESTIAAAYALNDPLIVAEGSSTDAGGGRARPGVPLIAVDRPNAVIETVKGAEDGRGNVVRLYESRRRRGRITLSAGVPLVGAWRTNLLEEDESELRLDGNTVALDLRPYEIATVRLLPRT